MLALVNDRILAVRRALRKLAARSKHFIAIAQ